MLNPFGGGGGGGSSFSSGGIGSGNDKSTETNTTSNTSYVDSRSVTDASGGGVVGSNTISNTNNSQATTNYALDGSEHQTWTWSSVDSSTKNTTNTNSGNSTTTWNTTDGGAFETVVALGAAQVSGARDIAKASLDLTGGVVNKAFDALQVTSKGAYDFAGSSQAMSYASSASALGMVQSGFAKLAELSTDVVKSATLQTAAAADKAKDAYQGAADTASGVRQLMIVGVIAAVIVGLYTWGRK